MKSCKLELANSPVFAIYRFSNDTEANFTLFEKGMYMKQERNKKI